MKQIFPKPVDAPAPRPLTLGDLAPGDFFVFVDPSDHPELCLKLDYNSLNSKSGGRTSYVQFRAGTGKAGPVLDGHVDNKYVRRVSAAIFETQDQAACPK